MGKPAKMTKAAIEAHLQDRARQSAWVFDRRKADQPRRVDAEDAIILD